MLRAIPSWTSLRELKLNFMQINLLTSVLYLAQNFTSIETLHIYFYPFRIHSFKKQAPIERITFPLSLGSVKKINIVSMDDVSSKILRKSNFRSLSYNVVVKHLAINTLLAPQQTREAI